MCSGSNLVLVFEENLFVCLGCKAKEPFKIRANVKLFLAFKKMNLKWAIKFVRDFPDKVKYGLERNGMPFGNLVACNQGVIFMNDYCGDEEGLFELQRALYEAFGIHNLHLSGNTEIMTYYPHQTKLTV